MTEKLSFLVRKLPKGSTQKLPREVAVVSVSLNAKSPHYVFKEAHHSVQFHPELNRHLIQLPVKHRHVTVTFTNGQICKYLNMMTGAFHFNGEPLRLWGKEISTLTGNKLIIKPFCSLNICACKTDIFLKLFQRFGLHDIAQSRN